MPTVRVGSVDVAYDVQGSGDALVLVHGSTGSRMTWLQQTPILAERFQVVLPEYAGGGETVDPGGPLEVDDLAAQIVGVVDHLGIDRFHLAGYSLGAVASIAVAAAHPERVRSLALVCAWAKTDARQRATFDLWQRLLQTDRELFARYVLVDGASATWHEAVGDSVESLVPIIAASLSAGSDRHAELDARVDVTDRLHAVRAPTLVIGGTDDRWVPIEHSRNLAATLGTASLVELPAGHMLPAEQGEELAKLLADHAAAH